MFAFCIWFSELSLIVILGYYSLHCPKVCFLKNPSCPFGLDPMELLAMLPHRPIAKLVYISASTGCHKMYFCAFRNHQINTAELIRRSMASYLAAVMILITHFSRCIVSKKTQGLLLGIFFIYQHVATSFQTHLSQKRMARTSIFGCAPDMGVTWCPCHWILGKKGVSKHSDQLF